MSILLLLQTIFQGPSFLSTKEPTPLTGPAPQHYHLDYLWGVIPAALSLNLKRCPDIIHFHKSHRKILKIIRGREGKDYITLRVSHEQVTIRWLNKKNGVLGTCMIQIYKYICSESLYSSNFVQM